MIESIKSNIRSSLSLQEEVIKYKFKHPVEYDSLEQIKISAVRVNAKFCLFFICTITD